MHDLMAHSLAFWQESAGVLYRIWAYLTQQFTFGQITVSVSSIIVGLFVFFLTIALSRSASALIERRIAHRRHIDPGLRYTISRLVKYFLITVGFLIALKQAFAVDLTSIAVIFTALSVGIGFGLQYLAADIASGFILLFERPIRVGDRITIDQLVVPRSARKDCDTRWSVGGFRHPAGN